jgi:uncharacterized protein
VDRAFSKGKNAAGVAALIRLSRDPDPQVFFRLGECYEKGLGALRNFPSAVRWYEAAAEHGMAEAMVKLGEIYLSGRLLQVSHPPGNAPAKPTSAAQGGRLSLFRNSVPCDYQKAIYWNSRAADAGSADAQARLGFQYATATGTAKDVVKAKDWFAAAAAQGNAAGQFGMGVLLANGTFGPPDTVAAASWFEKAVEGGDAQAKMALAQLLLNSRDAGIDCARLVSLLHDLADGGHTWAMFQLGVLYQDGIGMKQDLTLAETWLRRASSRQYLPAFVPLARLLSKQHPMHDDDAAAAVLRQGADLGDAGSQFGLSEIYALGVGVPLDLTESAVWFKKASSARQSVSQNI